jgi:hypothetical protein
LFAFQWFSGAVNEISVNSGMLRLLKSKISLILDYIICDKYVDEIDDDLYTLDRPFYGEGK